MTAVIFDVDGTLIDSVDLHARAWQDAFETFGHRIPFERIRSQIGKGGDQLMPEFLSREEVETRGPDLEHLRSRLFKEKYLSRVEGFPGVRDLFERLIADGWKIALASSAKGDELETYKRIANISDLLDAETSSDDAEKSKPHPDIFQAALRRLKLAPNEAVVVGDSPYDAQAATKAGIPSIGVLCGGFAAEELRAAGFLHLYAGAADVLVQYPHTLFHQRRPHSPVGS